MPRVPVSVHSVSASSVPVNPAPDFLEPMQLGLMRLSLTSGGKITFACIVEMLAIMYTHVLQRCTSVCLFLLLTCHHCLPVQLTWLSQFLSSHWEGQSQSPQLLILGHAVALLTWFLQHSYGQRLKDFLYTL